MASQTSETNKVKPANETKPPKAVMKGMNVVMKGLLRSPLHGRISNMLMLLTFTGSKSGKQFTTPVGYQREGDTITIITDSPWWKNLEGGAPVKMLVRGEELRGSARPITDKDNVLQATREFLQKNGVQNARQIGLNLDKSRMPTDDELRVILRDRVIVKIDVKGGPAQ